MSEQSYNTYNRNLPSVNTLFLVAYLRDGSRGTGFYWISKFFKFLNIILGV